MGSQSNGNNGEMPIGSIIWWYSSKLPPGFILCNGQSTSSYPKLAAVIGSKVPNLLGKFIYGAGLDEGLGTIAEDSTFTMTFDNKFPYFVDTDKNNVTKYKGYIATPVDGADGHYVNGMISGERTFKGKYKPMHIALFPIIKAK